MPIWIKISLALNALLLTALVYLALNKSQPASEGTTPAPRAVISETIVVPESTAPEKARAKPAQEPFHWRMIESEDYPRYISNLRAVGCPQKTIRDIIWADVENLYEKRGKELQPKLGFWDVNGRAKASSREAETKLNLATEKVALLKSLLGIELDREIWKLWLDDDDAEFFNLYFGYLSIDKIERVLSIFSGLGPRMEAALEDSYRGAPISKPQAYQDLFEALGQALTGPELDEGQLRVVFIMKFLFSGSDLKELSLTGHQLREIMRLTQIHENPIGREFLEEEDSDEEHEAPSPAWREALFNLLGEPIFSQYLALTDQDFERIFSFTRNRFLPVKVAHQLFEIQEEAGQEWKESQGRFLLDENLKLEADKIREITRKTLVELLGPRNYQEYSTNGGQWLPQILHKE